MEADPTPCRGKGSWVRVIHSILIHWEPLGWGRMDLKGMGFPWLVSSFVANSGLEIEHHIMLSDWHQGSLINQQVSVPAWSFSYCLPLRADTCHLLKSVHSLSLELRSTLFFPHTFSLRRWHYLGGCSSILNHCYYRFVFILKKHTKSTESLEHNSKYT